MQQAGFKGKKEVRRNRTAITVWTGSSESALSLVLLDVLLLLLLLVVIPSMQGGAAC